MELRLISQSKIIGDDSRQAIDAIRGYAYQIYASAIAWLQIRDDEILHLEVAEDFSVSSASGITATQAKATARNVTINDLGVIAAIESFFVLSKANPGRAVTIRFLTTSRIGLEREPDARIDGEPVLVYWRKAAILADVSPLRARLRVAKLRPATKAALDDMSDEEFRDNFLKRIIWDTGSPNLEELLSRLREALVQTGADRGISSSVVMKCLEPVIAKLLAVCTDPSNRSLTALDLGMLIAESTSIRVPIDQHLQQQQILQTLLAAQGLKSDATISPAISRDILRPISGIAGNSLAGRKGIQDAIFNRLSASRVAWLYAGAGFGKTSLSRLMAQRVGGTWKALNLRNFDAREVPDLLFAAAAALGGVRLTGVILDDVDFFERSEVAEAIQHFIAAADLNSCLLIANSYNKPSESAFSTMGLGPNAALQIVELNDTDISEVISSLGGKPEIWSRYVYLAAGSGHPQLVQALCRNLSNRGWPFEELENLNALLGGNSEIARTREETRRRLVSSLAPDQIDLLTRLTLIPGKFDRTIVLQLADGEPPIRTAGFVFDALVGPWVDETYQGVFQVSPLISDLALKTVSDNVRLQWQRHIVVAMTAGRSLDAGKMNAALLLAIATNEQSVLMKIAMATIQSDVEQLRNLSSIFFALQTMRADRQIYPSDQYLNVVLRLAQYLLVLHEASVDENKLNAVWETLLSESRAIDRPGHDILELMVLSKAVTSAPGRIPNMVDLLHRIYEISVATTYPEIRDSYTVVKGDEETTALGIMFLMNAQNLPTIDDTAQAFRALDKFSSEFRAKIFAALHLKEMDADMYLSGPWLKEHAANSINSNRHAEVYREISLLARRWMLDKLALSATKYQAIILDEYGNSPAEALSVLSQAEEWVGIDNWELLRSQGKILYRAKRYEDAIPYYDRAIATGIPGTAVERTFMLREAGICAAETGKWLKAAKVYENARNAALVSDLRSMKIMATGLLGDAGVAYWHAGEPLKFVELFAVGLRELSALDVDETLTARHCHALYRHSLLWAQDQITGDVIIKDGSPKMITGAISDPEPNASITSQPIGTLYLAWYMLAAIEIQCSNEQNIVNELPVILNGRKSRLGEAWLSGFALSHYQRTGNSAGIIATTKKIAIDGVIARSDGLYAERPDLTKPDLVDQREPTVTERAAAIGVLENLVVASAVVMLINNKFEGIRELGRLISSQYRSDVSGRFVESVLQTESGSDDFSSVVMKCIIERARLGALDRLHPNELARLQLYILQLAQLGSIPDFARERLMFWMKETWVDALNHQAFLLKMPGIFGRQLHNINLDGEPPLASASKVVALAIDHISVPVTSEVRSMIASISAGSA